MSLESYLESLPLADLPAPRTRRGPGDTPSADDIPTSDMQAAVNASTLLSFVDGIEGAEKDDVLYSIQFAQRAASAAHDRYIETPAWYRLYVDVLEQLGWAGEQFAFTATGESQSEVQMDKEALQIISAIATGNQLAVITKSIEALGAMADEDGAIDLFEFQSSNVLGGNFQVGAVEKGANDLLSIALGAFYFRATERKKKFLFFKWRRKEVEFFTAAQRMVFNPGIYAVSREVVKERLQATAKTFIANIPLA